MADPTKETKADKPLTEKIGDTLHETKEKAKDVVTPDRPEKDWEDIKHPGTMPASGDPYGTRPVSELTPPPVVTDKADLAAARMLDREKMERERIMTTATVDAAAARAAMTQKEMTPAEIEAERERTKAGAAVAGAAGATGAAAKQAESEAERERRMKTGAVVGGAALAAGAAASRTSPETPPTGPMVTERPVPGVVVPPGTTTTTPMKPYGTADERSRMHAEDPSVHPDWETQPQINAPRDVGIQTPEGQADAARIRAGRRRSNEAMEPRLERRGEDVSVPAASSARAGGVTGAVKETASDVEKKTKETVSEVKKDVERKI